MDCSGIQVAVLHDRSFDVIHIPAPHACATCGQSGTPVFQHKPTTATDFSGIDQGLNFSTVAAAARFSVPGGPAGPAATPADVAEVDLGPAEGEHHSVAFVNEEAPGVEPGLALGLEERPGAPCPLLGMPGEGAVLSGAGPARRGRPGRRGSRSAATGPARPAAGAASGGGRARGPCRPRWRFRRPSPKAAGPSSGRGRRHWRRRRRVPPGRAHVRSRDRPRLRGRARTRAARRRVHRRAARSRRPRSHRGAHEKGGAAGWPFGHELAPRVGVDGQVATGLRGRGDERGDRRRILGAVPPYRLDPAHPPRVPAHGRRSWGADGLTTIDHGGQTRQHQEPGPGRRAAPCRAVPGRRRAAVRAHARRGVPAPRGDDPLGPDDRPGG